MKRKVVAFALATIVGATVLAGCAGNSASKSQGGTFTPGKSVDWYCTSSPGGGSDIFSRQISDIMTAENMVNNQAIVVTNKTDGSGEVGRNEVANTKSNKADYTLLTFNSGDLMPMAKTGLRILRFLQSWRWTNSLFIKGIALTIRTLRVRLKRLRMGNRLLSEVRREMMWLLTKL